MIAHVRLVLDSDIPSRLDAQSTNSTGKAVTHHLKMNQEEVVTLTKPTDKVAGCGSVPGTIPKLCVVLPLGIDLSQDFKSHKL